MATSTDATLAYGYDLGDPEDEWKVTGLDWWDLDAEDEYGDPLDFRDAVHGRFPGELGVTAIRYCSASAPKYILAAHCFTAHRGTPREVDPAVMAVRQEDADARLARAVEALGITPTQESPGWLLVSDWG